MRVIVIPLLAAAASVAAADTGAGSTGAATGQPGQPAETIAPPGDALTAEMRDRLRSRSGQDEICRDRITLAREAAGKPPLLDREPASPDKPHRIYAVDKRVDGCSVMVMMGDTADMRPLPSAPDGPLRIIPLGSGR